LKEKDLTSQEGVGEQKQGALGVVAFEAHYLLLPSPSPEQFQQSICTLVLPDSATTCNMVPNAQKIQAVHARSNMTTGNSNAHSARAITLHFGLERRVDDHRVGYGLPELSNQWLGFCWSKCASVSLRALTLGMHRHAQGMEGRGQRGMLGQFIIVSIHNHISSKRRKQVLVSAPFTAKYPSKRNGFSLRNTDREAQLHPSEPTFSTCL
jgi:hypothetical protein